MKQILTLFTGILLAGQFIWPTLALANTLQSKSKTLKVTARPAQAKSNSEGVFLGKVKICTEYKNNKKCEEYPKRISSFVFTGSTKDWGYFFNRCMNFDTINTLTDTSLILSTLVLMPKIGLMKTLGLELGISFVGTPPYPEDVNKKVLGEAANIVYSLLKDEKKTTYIEAKKIIALKKILNVCSTAFESDYKNKLNTRCLMGCHGN